ncbi:cytochrome P450 2G1-like [Rhinoraja longicauda]
MEQSVAAVILALTAILLLYFWGNRGRKGWLPPGPTALPLIGNALHIDKRAPDRSLIQLGRKYGPVFTVWLGPRPAVVLCGFKAVKEALVDQADDFGARGTVPSIRKITNGYDTKAVSNRLNRKAQAKT